MTVPYGALFWKSPCWVSVDSFPKLLPARAAGFPWAACSIPLFSSVAYQVSRDWCYQMQHKYAVRFGSRHWLLRRILFFCEAKKKKPKNLKPFKTLAKLTWQICMHLSLLAFYPEHAAWLCSTLLEALLAAAWMFPVSVLCSTSRDAFLFEIFSS